MASIYQVIEILSKEKGIDSQIIADAVKDAMIVAARKHFRSTEDMDATFDAKGMLHIAIVKKVVETVEDPVNQLTLEQARKIDPTVQLDGEIRKPLPTDVLGRIAAQTAKQVILQKVREAERDTVFKAFAGREGDMVQCTVKRVEGLDLVLEIDREKLEVRLPKREQSRLDSFQVGDRIKATIRGVEKGGKNSGVIVSRAAPELVMRLFEQEVPEIYDNTVVIKACAREAGERTKIAVWSRDRDVDCVGACVGMKGMRVQSIIRELRNEKIDIIEYSDEPSAFATHALSPAKISRVAILDPLDRHMEVIVDDSQLSLAIGKKGQNVRLAAKLLGWKIDIKSEEEKRQEVETQMSALQISGAPISVLADYGIDDPILDALLAGEVNTVEKLGSLTPEQLSALEGIGEENVQRVVNAINAYYNQYEGGGEAAPETGEVPAEGPEEVAGNGEADGSGVSDADLTATESPADAAASESTLPDPAAAPADPADGATESVTM